MSTSGAATISARPFLLPREPRLHWKMLYPRSSKRVPNSPVSGQSSYEVFWARNAIYHGLKALQICPGDNILVPSFHCAAAVEPIFRYGATVKFYRIHRDCSPDFSDIQAKIDQKTRAVLAIHYFGFPQPIQQFQEFCQSYRVYLIEDCAHVLTGEAGNSALGSFGDISVFSWRKFLPLYDGGHLVINNPQLHADIPWEGNTILFGLKVAKNVLDKLIDDSACEAVKCIAQLWRFPHLCGRRTLSVHGHQPTVFTINNNSADFNPALVNLRMSSFSKYILQNIEISAIVEQRRRNYTQLLKALDALPGITPFFPLLPNSVCPWIFPVLAHGRPDFHVILRARGIPAVTWGGVIHRQLRLEEFPDAAFLYRNLVFLPIHQSLRDSDVQTMSEVITEILDHENCQPGRDEKP